MLRRVSKKSRGERVLSRRVPHTYAEEGLRPRRVREGGGTATTVDERAARGTWRVAGTRDAGRGSARWASVGDVDATGLGEAGP